MYKHGPPKLGCLERWNVPTRSKFLKSCYLSYVVYVANRMVRLERNPVSKGVMACLDTRNAKLISL